jgi:hypothetical protein
LRYLSPHWFRAREPTRQTTFSNLLKQINQRISWLFADSCVSRESTCTLPECRDTHFLTMSDLMSSSESGSSDEGISDFLGPAEELNASGSSGVSDPSVRGVNDVDWSQGHCRGCDGTGPLGATCTVCWSTRATRFQYESYLGVCGRCEHVGDLGEPCLDCIEYSGSYEYLPFKG